MPHPDPAWHQSLFTCAGWLTLCPCLPLETAGVLLTLNVSTAAQMVSLKPALRRPNVDGIRVEVNGQAGCGQWSRSWRHR